MCPAAGRPITHCRICGGSRLEPVIDLGVQPWANHFVRPEEAGTEPRYPLRVAHCGDCSLAQLDYTVPKEILFGHHTYLSGLTRTLTDHFAAVARDVDTRFMQGRTPRTILDIGSNDGAQLREYRARGFSVLGVESSAPTARIANEAGTETVHAFFDESLARSFGRTFDVINASGVFFHLEDLHSVTDGIRHCLAADGVFVVQFIYVQSLLRNLAFDQLYHEHLLYYSLETIGALLQRHGLEMFDAHVSPIHGGSVVGFVGHRGQRDPSSRLKLMQAAEQEAGTNARESYRQFARDILVKRQANLAFLHGERQAGRRVFGMGAPVKGNTLLNYLQAGPDLIECLVEKNPTRKGLLSPGMHIPVVLEDELAAPPDTYFVLAWNFRDEILRNNQHLLARGIRFHFPVGQATP